MKYRKIGNTDLNASVIGLGTFEIGGSSWWGTQDDKKSLRSINHAIDLGVNFIDTAPVYGFGRSEKLVGKAANGRRDKLIISTKCGEEFTDFSEGRFHYKHDGKAVYTCLSSSSIHRQLESSLRNLNTDYIDIYSPHFFFDTPEVGRINEIMETLLKLKEQGKIRHVGISNVSKHQLKEFNESHQLGISAVQLYCNVLDQEILSSDIYKYIVDNNISAIGINTLAKGLLAGAFPDDYVVPPGSERSESPWFSGGRTSEVNRMLGKWARLSQKYQIDYASIAISWVLAQKSFTHILVGATSPEQINDNVKAAEISFTQDDIKYMSELGNQLKKDLIEPEISSARKEIEKLVDSQEPVMIWGVGITSEYISRKIPISKCNIISVYDSNTVFNNEVRFGKKVLPLCDIRKNTASATIIALIPSDPHQLNKILESYSFSCRVIHLGHLKPLCK